MPAQQTEPVQVKTGDYGLRGEALTPMETLAQSVSTIAPTCTPAATIPLVAALAGNGTWLAYLLAMIAILLVAWCISRFARYSASPGSLYTYAAMILPPWLGAVAAWSLLLAYVATGSSVIGGFYHYANFLFVDVVGRGFSGAAIALIATAANAVWITWRDVKISARMMLWFEGASLLVILTVVLLCPRAAWAACGSQPIALDRDDRQWTAPRASAGAFQLCRVRERHDVGRRGAQSPENNSARGY